MYMPSSSLFNHVCTLVESMRLSARMSCSRQTSGGMPISPAQYSNPNITRRRCIITDKKKRERGGNRKKEVKKKKPQECRNRHRSSDMEDENCISVSTLIQCLRFSITKIFYHFRRKAFFLKRARAFQARDLSAPFSPFKNIFKPPHSSPSPCISVYHSAHSRGEILTLQNSPLIDRRLPF